MRTWRLLSRNAKNRLAGNFRPFLAPSLSTVYGKISFEMMDDGWLRVRRLKRDSHLPVGRLHARILCFVNYLEYIAALSCWVYLWVKLHQRGTNSDKTRVFSCLVCLEYIFFCLASSLVLRAVSQSIVDFVCVTERQGSRRDIEIR